MEKSIIYASCLSRSCLDHAGVVLHNFLAITLVLCQSTLLAVKCHPDTDLQSKYSRLHAQRFVSLLAGGRESFCSTLFAEAQNYGPVQSHGASYCEARIDRAKPALVCNLIANFETVDERQIRPISKTTFVQVRRWMGVCQTRVS